MKRPQLITLLLLTIVFVQPLFGQMKKSEQEFKDYMELFKGIKVDTILILKSGCTGCDVKYNDTSRSVIDGQSIHVLTQINGQYKLASFDDIHKSKVAIIDTCSLFNFINHNKQILEEKETFYQGAIPKIKSKSGFYPPSPIHYSFEQLNIHLSKFTYNFEVRDEDKDEFGLKRNNENWFIVTKAIIKKVYSY